MPILDRLDDGIDRVSHFISGSLTSRGQFIGGCESRALETGLFLHLMRSRREDHPAQVPLARYCRRYLDGAGKNASSLDAVIAATICRGVLGLPLHAQGHAQGHARLKEALRAFDHPTQRRKIIFFTTLFADLGLLTPPTEDPSSPDPNQQVWVTVIMTSLRIINATSRGRPELVRAEDIAFLVAEQSPSGGWEQHVLATLVALLALHRADAGEEAQRRGIAYVIDQMRDDGGVPFIADEDTWVTCLSAHILAEARPSTCDLNAVARYLLSEQRPDGGWAYSQGVRQTDADDTSISLAFLSRHDPLAHREAIRQAQWYLLALQNEDGGFPTFTRGAASEAEITAKAILALRTSSDMFFQSRIDRGWLWLARAQRPDGSFRAEWKLSATYPALHVLTAARTSEQTPQVAKIRAGAAAFLRSWRQPNGGWGLRPDDREVHLLSTAYAVAGLATDVSELSRTEFSRSVALLLEMQASDGGFYSSGDSLGPRPFVYDVPLLASIYSLLALSRSRLALRQYMHAEAPKRPRKPAKRGVERVVHRAPVPTRYPPRREHVPT